MAPPPEILMGSLRRQRLVRFREDILADTRDSDDNLFRILYGLPAEVQIDRECNL